jgi:hypothetical protein
MQRANLERIQRIILLPNLPLELGLKESYSFVSSIVLHIPRKAARVADNLLPFLQCPGRTPFWLEFVYVASIGDDLDGKDSLAVCTLK